MILKDDYHLLNYQQFSIQMQSVLFHSNAICTLRKSHCTCFEIWRNTIL